MSICKRAKEGDDSQVVPFSPIRVLTSSSPSPFPSPAADTPFLFWLVQHIRAQTRVLITRTRSRPHSLYFFSLSLPPLFFCSFYFEWPLSYPTPASISAAAAVRLCIPVPRPCLPLPPRVPDLSRPTAHPSLVFALLSTSTSPILLPSPIPNTRETTRTLPTLQLSPSVQTLSPPLTPLRTTIWLTRRWERRCSGRRTSEHAPLLPRIREMRRASIRPHPRPKISPCSYLTPHKISTIPPKGS